MTIQYFKGDILESDVDMIVHQVNTYGVMGGGLAKQIKDKYPNVYHIYRAYTQSMHPEKLLGRFVNIKTDDGQIITNLFSQGHSENQSSKALLSGPVGTGKSEAVKNMDTRPLGETNYEAMRDGLTDINNYASSKDMTVAIPYKIGCGIGGGDWSRVEDIIYNIFKDSRVLLKIYYLPSKEGGI